MRSMHKKSILNFIGTLVFVFAMSLFARGAEAAVPVMSFSADSTTLATGMSTNLTWDVTDSVGCMASGDWLGAKPFSGTESVGPFGVAQTYTFTLTCSGSESEVETVSVAIEVADPPTLSFIVDESSIEYNTATVINWSSTGADTCVASGDWSGAKGLTGAEGTGNLISLKTYNLECTGVGGTASGTVVVSVTSPTASPALSFAASDYFVSYNTPVDLTWAAENSDACVASGSWSGARTLSGTENTGNLLTDEIYSLTCTGEGGSITGIVTIVVGPEPVFPPELTFTADNNNIAYGASTMLNWSSLNTDSCSASGSWGGSRSLSGSYDTGSLTSTRTYTLKCDGPGGSVNQDVTINVGPNPDPPPTLNFSADSGSIPYDSSTNLTWSTTDAVSCTASDDWSGSKGTSGTEGTGNLTSSQEYDLTCSGPGGTISDSVTVVVGDPLFPPTMTFTADAYDVTYNTGTVVRWDTEDANSCTLTRGASSGSVGVDGSYSTGNLLSDTFYSLTCSNAAGSTNQNFIITSTMAGSPPAISLWADENPIDYGSSTMVNWLVTDADSCTFVGLGSVPMSGSESTGNLYLPVTVTINCSGPGGNSSESLTININPATVPADVPDLSFWADAYTLLEGENTDLHWTSLNADWCTASGGWSGNKALSGVQNTGDLYTTRTYHLTCGNIVGEITASVTIDVGNYPAVALDFWADSYNLESNGYTTLRWDSTNATSCYTYGGEWGSWGGRSLDGTEDVGPLTDYDNLFVLRCVNFLNTTTVSVNIVAGDPPPSIAFYASSTNLVYNTPATLFWDATNATYCETWSTNSNEPTWDNSSIGPSGTHTTVNLRQNTRFYIECYGPGGSTTENVLVNVVDEGHTAPSINFWADNYGVSSGGSTNVHWTTTNATGCRALSSSSVGWADDPKALSGDQSVGPITEDINDLYLVCWNGSYGSATTSIRITNSEGSAIKPNMSFWADEYSIASGSSTILRWNVVNATSCTADDDWGGSKSVGFSNEDTGSITSNKHYTLTCDNSGGYIESYVDIVVGGPAGPPALTLWADDYDIEAGEVVNLSWTSSNATSCYASGGVTTDWTGGQTLNGGRGVAPSYSTTFGLTCDGPGGSVTANVPIKVSRVLVCPVDVRVNRSQTRQLTAYYAEDATPGLSCSNLSGVVNISGGFGGFSTDWTTADSSLVSLQATPGLVLAESYSVAPVSVCAEYKEITGCAGVRVVTTCWECVEGPACLPVGVPADTCPAPYFSDSPSCLSVCSLQWGDWREVTP